MFILFSIFTLIKATSITVLYDDSLAFKLTALPSIPSFQSSAVTSFLTSPTYRYIPNILAVDYIVEEFGRRKVSCLLQGQLFAEGFFSGTEYSRFCRMIHNWWLQIAALGGPSDYPIIGTYTNGKITIRFENEFTIDDFNMLHI